MINQSADESTFSRLAKPYAKEGIRVFPVQSSGKRPLIKNWPKMATSELQQIQAWAREWPNANLGLLTGASTNLLVLDVDGKEGAESLAEIQLQYEDRLPETFTVETGNGGKHYYFNHPGWKVTSTVGLFDSVDIRADGAYVVGPGSKHESGAIYEIISPPGVKCADPPQWLLDSITADNGRNHDKPPVDPNEPIPQGKRNNTLASLAGKLRRQGFNQDEIEAALLVVNQNRCFPPLPEEEVKNTAASIAQYEPAHSINDSPTFTEQNSTIGGMEYTDGMAPSTLTDGGNADRLREKFKDEAMFSYEQGLWYVFTGGRWKLDRGSRVNKRAKRVVKDIYREAGKKGGTDEGKELWKWAKQSDSAIRRRDMLKMAECDMEVSEEKLDANPDLFNMSNGTYDLENDTFRDHDRKDLLTKQSYIQYDPDATCLKWEEALKLWTDDDSDLMGFLQRTAGSCLVGRAPDHCVQIFYGPKGNNGKSTYLNTLSGLLGGVDRLEGYAKSLSAASLTKERWTQANKPRDDIAKLKGARMAMMVELDQNKTLNEGLLKAMTGGDPLTARWSYGRFEITFIPQFKLIIATNHKPDIEGRDGGIWRRVKVVPWDVQIEPGTAIPDYHKVLLAEEGPGIFNWALEGYRQWKKYGIGEPERVMKQTAEYKHEQDSFTLFLEEQCVKGAYTKIKASLLYSTYRDWCKEQGVHTISQRDFSHAVQAEGCAREREANGYFYHGLGLHAEPDRYEP